MDGLYQYIWQILLLIFAWFIQTGWKWFAFGMFFIWFQWYMKMTIREGVEEAMKKGVLPVLEDIRDSLARD